MKSSLILAATGAALALAGPLDKRVIETDVVVEYYTVTVTGKAPEPTPTHTQVKVPKPTQPTVVVVTVTPEAQPEPEPTTTIVKQVSKPSPSPVADTPAQSNDPAPPADNSMQSAALYHHNIHRSNHSSPELTWNDEIAGYAAKTAATCVFKHDMSEGSGGYGQNIALWGVSSGAEKLGQAGAVKMAATNMWYDGEFNAFEPSYYGQATPDMGNFESWGHLTQLVWASTTSVGCAVQFCPKGTSYQNLDAWFTVCNYSPPGNVGGAYAKNINRPKGDAAVVV
ncbi:CAP domain-containing protein [Nemania sp. FL0916]|nr:CAP domain-containing protein [Nemania sp. FL0916]